MSNHTLPLFSLQPETREIPLTQCKVAIVDAADYEWLSQWKWHAAKSNKTFYARRNGGSLPNGGQRVIIMHRLILGAPLATEVDHCDGNGLNNTRNNLRLATHQQNSQNVRRRKDNTSGYKGVRWHQRCNKWHAQIRMNGKNKHLGLFNSLEEAVRAYDDAARQLHGEFARPNHFP